jgi:Domain of unknown function (DUF2017)
MRRILAAGSGKYELHLDEREREVLRIMLGELRDLLIEGNDDSLQRLFPPAYANDDEHEAEYQALAYDELLQNRLGGLDLVEHTLNEVALDDEQLNDWLKAVNELRLVIGTQLDVTEDEAFEVADDDPERNKKAVYLFLGYLLDDIVDALASGL